MPEDDIYHNESKYKNFLKNMIEGKELLKKPSERKLHRSQNHSKYWCKNKANLKYFLKLNEKLEAKNISYIRRNKLFLALKVITYVMDKDLKDCDRDEVDRIMAFMHTRYKTVKSKRDFIVDLKRIWKTLFPELDEKGRADDDLIPYAVRHLHKKDIDKSLEKEKDDILGIEEFEKLVKAFSQDIRMQTYLTLAFESLGRPQEILYTKIKDVNIHDNYATIDIAEHGKEGTGFLECIDSFPYVAEWYNKHPLRHDKNAFFFINLGDAHKHKQLTPVNINKHLREKLKLLGIHKTITCYSLKRSGVTFRRLRGDSDATIQHAARWTSTKQLGTYDKSRHKDSFKIELARRGLIKDDKLKQYEPTSKKCAFCGTINGIGDDTCNTCKRPTDRKKIVAEIEGKDARIKVLETDITDIKGMLKDIAKEKIKAEVGIK
jgi:integrase